MSLRGHLAMSTDIFGCHNPGMGVWGAMLLEAKDTAEQFTMHRTAPTTKNCLA